MVLTQPCNPSSRILSVTHIAPTGAEKACTSVRSLLGRMARSGLRQQLLSTELYLKDIKRLSIRDMFGVEPADLGCLESHTAKTRKHERNQTFLAFLHQIPSQRGCCLSEWHWGSRPAGPHKRRFHWLQCCPLEVSSRETDTIQWHHDAKPPP